MYIEWVTAIFVGLFVGVGCYEWGVKKGKDDAQAVYEKREEARITKEREASKRELEQKYKNEEEYEKELDRVKYYLNTYNLPSNKEFCVAFRAMLIEHFGYIPPEWEFEKIQNYIKSNKKYFKDHKKKELKK